MLPDHPLFSHDVRQCGKLAPIAPPVVDKYDAGTLLPKLDSLEHLSGSSACNGLTFDADDVHMYYLHRDNITIVISSHFKSARVCEIDNMGNPTYLTRDEDKGLSPLTP